MSMASFLQQVFTLLTTDTGSLTYQLVLAFSIAGGLQAAINHWRSTNFPQGRRMVVGLSLLLALRLALFLSAALAWQGLISADVGLPLIDRAVTLLSLILILWLWVFPEPLRAADTTTLMISLLTITLIILGMVWWTNQAVEGAFNGSAPDRIAEIAALVLILLAILLLAVRRPNGWGLGLAMFGLEFLGHLGHLVLPMIDRDYSGSVRLAQMAAYPLLLTLPQRFPLFAFTPKTAREHVENLVDVDGVPLDPTATVYPSLLAVSVEPDPEKACAAAAGGVARALGADLCLLLLPSSDSGRMSVACGYDLTHEEVLPGAELEEARMQALSTAFQQGRPLYLPDSSTSPDLVELGRVFSLERTGPLLAVPVIPEENAHPFWFVLLSPYSNRGWTGEDQDLLVETARPLAQYLHLVYQIERMQGSLQQAQVEMQAAQDRALQAVREQEDLAEQIDILRRTAEHDRSQLESLAAMVAELDVAQEAIGRLQTENESLRQAVELASNLQPKGNGTGDALLDEGEDGILNVEHLSGELRLAQEEAATLKAALAEAEQKAAFIERTVHPQPEDQERSRQLTAIVQELRQPMSSIVGYTDFLLGESVGALGQLQRKFLERVRAATERMDRLVNDLDEITATGSEKIKVNREAVDLSEVIDEAISNTSTQLREKNIALRVDLPESLPRMITDRQALQQILIHLLQNAGEVTPEEGDILLRARVEGSESDLDYILLQIADEGGGIPVDEINNVFSHYHPAPISGIGESGLGLTIVKSLAEALEGRVWVDSQVGQGAIYSVLLPVSVDFPEAEEPRDENETHRKGWQEEEAQR